MQKYLKKMDNSKFTMEDRNSLNEIAFKVDQILDILRGSLENPSGLIQRIMVLEKEAALTKVEILELDKFKENVMKNTWKAIGAGLAVQAIFAVIVFYLTTVMPVLNKNEKVVIPPTTNFSGVQYSKEEVRKSAK